ncbi:MAG TPA: type VI secretion system tip protein VgrG [Candidatus Kapabacteria bacterium]|nr:type VI secretion system tip protein VgrG [Candidatus Kapabacteria bacterium]
MAREHQLLGAYVTKPINRIAAARLVYYDGVASKSDFPLSNDDMFKPGAEIEILAGSGDNPESIFKGIVVRQSLKVRDASGPQLIVECRHKAVKLTDGRKDAYYFDKTDSDIIGSLLSNAGVSADVESTSVTHKQQVQYRCTDWDFLLTRAEANGRIVLTNDDKVAVKAPSFSGSPVCTLLYGATIIEMDMEMDARGQYSAVKSYTWDASQQSVQEKEAADPGVTTPGNITSDDLADVVGLDHFELDHATITVEEAQAWADAAWLKSRMNKVTGRIKCEGIASVNPGDIVKLDGVGDRFNGNAFVTGVRQDLDLVQGWKTHIQFGNTGAWLAQEEDVSERKASALLPGINGLQIGVVVSNEDPDGEDRVRVRMPLVSPDDDGTWARVASLDAGKDRGYFFRPEIGDEVVLGFLNDDPRQAVILGMLNSSANPAPLKGSNDNNEKVYQSRSKMKFYFNDEKKIASLETPAGNKLTLTEEDKAITIVDQNGNKIEMNQDGIRIESQKAIELKAGTEVKMESGTSFGVKGGTDLKMEGASSAELSSSATTKVKGSMVQLN